MLIYIREIFTLGLKYYTEMKDAPLYYMLRQASIQTQNQLIFFSDYIWKDFPGTGRSTGAYMIFYQGNTIDHEKYVPGPVAQSSA